LKEKVSRFIRGMSERYIGSMAQTRSESVRPAHLSLELHVGK